MPTWRRSCPFAVATPRTRVLLRGTVKFQCHPGARHPGSMERRAPMLVDGGYRGEPPLMTPYESKPAKPAVAQAHPPHGAADDLAGAGRRGVRAGSPTSGC